MNGRSLSILTFDWYLCHLKNSCKHEEARDINTIIRNHYSHDDIHKDSAISITFYREHWAYIFRTNPEVVVCVQSVNMSVSPPTEFFIVPSIFCRILRIWPLLKDGSANAHFSNRDRFTYLILFICFLVFVTVGRPRVEWRSFESRKHTFITTVIAYVLALTKCFGIFMRRHDLANLVQKLYQLHNAAMTIDATNGGIITTQSNNMIFKWCLLLFDSLWTNISQKNTMGDQNVRSSNCYSLFHSIELVYGIFVAVDGGRIVNRVRQLPSFTTELIL